ncbi:hypothetical protein [Methanoculleus bourgensis]|uniref:hypothetical protein n=1 Tax=Methanoculleus bourgensis TaxID=83986 RepID=UPI000784677B|nr:hypothetical protein [Methanoculleus bourgensis]
MRDRVGPGRREAGRDSAAGPRGPDTRTHACDTGGHVPLLEPDAEQPESDTGDEEFDEQDGEGACNLLGESNCQNDRDAAMKHTDAREEVRRRREGVVAEVHDILPCRLCRADTLQRSARFSGARQHTTR